MLISTKLTTEIPQTSTKQEDLFGEIVNCDLCDKDDFKPLLDEYGFTFGQCRNCSLYYIRVRPTEERQAKIVEDTSFKNSQSSMKEEFLVQSLFREEECSEYLQTIENFVKGGRLLDVGCGIGTLIWFAKKRHWQVEGVELNKYKLEIARRMNIGKIYSRPVEELNLPKVSYDIVAMINVFGHLRSPKRTLKHLMSLIKPHGCLIMRTGELRHNPTKRDLPPSGLGIPHHLYCNSQKTFELYGKAIDADIIYYKSIPFNEYFIRNKFRYKSNKWYKQCAKKVLRNIPGLINLVISWDNWNKRDNPIYDTIIIYKKRS
jgi:2-polyprenyl-3-methyl-5-hydroxy-6-metoxy-1,4-benzoquinol methylase